LSNSERNNQVYGQRVHKEGFMGKYRYSYPLHRPKEVEVRERSIFVRLRWEDVEVPEKTYHALSPGDAQRFIDGWAKSVASPMFVEIHGIKAPRDVLKDILA
jgi:hypothetical protein